ncbi:metallophosphoesterase family protein [Clostridium drakei]|uniref:Calcineurin-like phosphoesterase domain-containing protein n=1 Tax=Clostridium drakei TaxID=332101 RepID=A0A2U8DVC6_9CLOT|nr:metallophosphoesterase [Clostridium drakei]AWI06723.1 hypothetical protein B9W14_20230 [Clostridium drakei]
MKIFSTSDIHGNFGELQKIIDFANSRIDIDVVIFCGDIAKDYKWSSIKELRTFQSDDYSCFKYMISKILNKRIYYILGNHDVFLPDGTDMNYLTNVYKVGMEDASIPFEMLSNNLYETDREGTEKELEIALQALGEVKEKFIVSHQPPYKCLDKGYSGHNYGSRSIRKMILHKNPSVFFCGHIHEEFGVDRLGNTVVINCACSRSIARGIIFDTETNVFEEIILEEK